MREVRGLSARAVRMAWTLALVLGIIGAVLGVLGWRSALTDTYGWSEVAYRTVALFVLEFMGDGAGSVGPLLSWARFIAPLATAVAFLAAALGLMLRSWTRFFAGRRSDHIVVVGDGVGTVALAVNLRQADMEVGASNSGGRAGRASKRPKVTLVSTPRVQDDDQLRANGVQVVTGASREALKAVVEGASRVFIDYATDAESAHAAVALSAQCSGLSMVTIFNEPELADHWESRERLPGLVVSQVATVAVEAFASTPRYSRTRCVLPPS